MALEPWTASSLEDRRQVAARVAQSMQDGATPAARVPIDDVLRQAQAAAPLAREQVNERTQEIRSAVLAGNSTPAMARELRDLAVEADRLSSTPRQLATLKEAGVSEIALSPSAAVGRERLAEISVAAAATAVAQRIGPSADADRAALAGEAARQVRFESPQRFIETQAAELGQRYGKDAAWMRDAGQQARWALDRAAEGAGLPLDPTKIPTNAFSNAALKSYADNPRALEDVIAGALSTGQRMRLADADAKVLELSGKASHELLAQGVLREDRLKLGMGTSSDRGELAAIQSEMLQLSSLRHQIASLRERGLETVVIHGRQGDTPRDALHAIQSSVNRADQDMVARHVASAAVKAAAAQQSPAPVRSAESIWDAAAKAGAALPASRAEQATSKRAVLG